MKKTVQYTLQGLLVSSLFIGGAQAKQSTDVSNMKNLELCVDYSTLPSNELKEAYFAELDRRGQLSHKDYERIPKHEVDNTSTICGMYMALGKPLAEQSRQLRPMVFKAVHVYPDRYYVSQSGMIVASYERKPGEMPPQLIPEKPAVEAPPVLR
jgi:hypothetical protein